MRLATWTISKRLRVGLGLIVGCIVVLTIAFIFSLSVVNGRLEQVIKVNNAKIALAYAIQNAVGDIDKAVLTAVLTGGVDQNKKKIDDARAAFQASMDKLEKLGVTADGKEILATIKENYKIAQNAHDNALQAVAQGNTGNAGNLVVGCLSITEMLGDSCAQLVKHQQERTSVAAKEAAAMNVKARLALLTVGAAVCAFAIFLASFLTRSIVKPLGEGVSVARRIAEGDLTVQIETTGTDETAQLLKAMRNMVEKLREIIGGVKVAVEKMASSSQQLNSSAGLMSQGATEQAERVSLVAGASEEMSQTVTDIAKNAATIEVAATDTGKLAKNGDEVVAKSVEKIKTMAKTIDESGQLIRLLGDRSKQIGAIINVINEIADQTNLLALNATIEAARAGDAGRGFAVVADEVKKLADRTGSSTSEIAGMIKSIQDEVQETVRSMENITKEVKSSVDLSVETGNVLRTIVGGVDQLHVRVHEIASATEEMAATSEEINRDIKGIESVSRDTSTQSEQVASASRELSRLSESLTEVVTGFRV